MALALVRFRRRADGLIAVRLAPGERQVLRVLLEDLAQALASDDPATARLYPPAHPDDPVAEAEYRSLVASSLEDGRRANLGVVAETLEADHLDDVQASAWLAAINDLRLVMGARLEIVDDLAADLPPEDDERYPEFVQLLYLGWLEEQLVDALARGLDEP